MLNTHKCTEAVRLDEVRVIIEFISDRIKPTNKLLNRINAGYAVFLLALTIILCVIFDDLKNILIVADVYFLVMLVFFSVGLLWGRGIREDLVILKICEYAICRQWSSASVDAADALIERSIESREKIITTLKGAGAVVFALLSVIAVNVIPKVDYSVWGYSYIPALVFTLLAVVSGFTALAGATFCVSYYQMNKYVRMLSVIRFLKKIRAADIRQE